MAMQDDLTDALLRGDALVIVDVQNDFCPGGAFPIERGSDIIPILNRCITAAAAKHIPLYASRDWHPVDHVSFVGQGGQWPPHCIQDSEGAQFHPDLQLPTSVIKITKGVRFDHDQNSIFDSTGLTYHLRKKSIKRLWVGGLAEDVCVLATVLDARREELEVVLIENATRPVSAEGRERARKQMREAGVQFASG
jgi:nicotinamidase/pyrazinamidase